MEWAAVPADPAQIQKAQYKNYEVKPYSPLLVHWAFRWDIWMGSMTAPTQSEYLIFPWLKLKKGQDGD